MAPKVGPRGGIMNLTIKDKNVLYQTYMPFLKNGGLFLPTPKQYNMGDEVFIVLTLMDEPDKIPVAGKVCWITPVGAQNNRATGVGIHFANDSLARDHIERHLAGALNAARPTHTF